MGALRRLSRLAFALVLFLQAGMGAAHGLRGLGAAHGVLVEICTVGGKRVALLDHEGQPMKGPAEGGSGVCPACAGLPAVLVPLAPMASEPVVFGATPGFSLAGAAPPAPRGGAPPYSTRAPPVPA